MSTFKLDIDNWLIRLRVLSISEAWVEVCYEKLWLNRQWVHDVHCHQWIYLEPPPPFASQGRLMRGIFLQGFGCGVDRNPPRSGENFEIWVPKWRFPIARIYLVLSNLKKNRACGAVIAPRLRRGRLSTSARLLPPLFFRWDFLSTVGILRWGFFSGPWKRWGFWDFWDFLGFLRWDFFQKIPQFFSRAFGARWFFSSLTAALVPS